ncbi:intermembrane transport protein PqiB [Halioxenophilus aromaticivorans]|uniref:Intermembrane transport protein PqiB n=1 Tax=Halioxenophilus aromaticivorans TaxID=1306992 RepID=A0AAV3U3U9_9ALTE
MTNLDNNPDQEKAIIAPIKGISKIWLVPVVAFLIGAWILVHNVINQGPTITIEFDTAQGLEAGKTKIKIRDVTIGLIEEISLKDDSSGVIAKAAIEKSSSKLLKTDTQFWIVSPRISFGGVSGLQTLLSGAYINMAPGQESKSAKKFIALDRPPITPLGTPGLRVVLVSESAFTFKEGDLLIYQGMPVGRLETVKFDLEARKAYYGAFIEAPFHTLITENTRFWNASGIELSLSADGIDIKTGSLASLLSGGIEFDIPEGSEKGTQAGENAEFNVYPSFEAATTPHFTAEVPYLLLVNDSVRGLRPGAPVEYRGLRVGEVKEVNATFDLADFRTTDASFSIPVLISIQPARANLADNQLGINHVIEQMDLWLKQGLRASLKTGNLVTGAVFVDLQHYRDVAQYDEQIVQGYTVIPMVKGGIGELTQQVSNTLGKINALPLESLTQDMSVLIKDLTKTALTFESAGATLNSRLASFDVATLNETLGNLSQLLDDYSGNSDGFANVNDTLKEIQSTMKELTPMLQKLNHSPNSLIFKSKVGPDIEPRGIEQ